MMQDRKRMIAATAEPESPAQQLVLAAARHDAELAHQLLDRRNRRQTRMPTTAAAAP